VGVAVRGGGVCGGVWGGLGGLGLCELLGGGFLLEVVFSLAFGPLLWGGAGFFVVVFKGRGALAVVVVFDRGCGAAV